MKRGLVDEVDGASSSKAKKRRLLHLAGLVPPKLPKGAKAAKAATLVAVADSAGGGTEGAGASRGAPDLDAPDDGVIVCPVCGAWLFSPSQLVGHQPRHNTQEAARFKCAGCPWVAVSQAALDVHEAGHANVRRCKLCPFSTKMDVTYVKHLEGHAAYKKR